MKISVIIPTFNRLDILVKCLKALEAQTIHFNEFEVIVIDDGSTDGTEKLGAGLFEGLRINGIYLRQEQAGPAKARNKGISHGRGDLLVIIGDDIIATKDFLSEHLKIHHQEKERPLAVIGRIDWDPSIEITEFMLFLEKGVQFSFNDLNDDNISYKNCYTSNVSIKSDFIKKHAVYFSEEFPYAAYEDIEWGYRLMKSGITYKYNPKALAYHHHVVTLESYSNRMISVGKAYVHLLNLHPELGWRSHKSLSKFQYLRRTFKVKLLEYLLNNELHLFSLFKINNKKSFKYILKYYKKKGIIEELDQLDPI